ncbi:hypothetical protein R6Q59_015044 [Mikania micrantha]
MPTSIVTPETYILIGIREVEVSLIRPLKKSLKKHDDVGFIARTSEVGFIARTTKKLSDSLGYVATAYNFDVIGYKWLASATETCHKDNETGHGAFGSITKQKISSTILVIINHKANQHGSRLPERVGGSNCVVIANMGQPANPIILMTRMVLDQLTYLNEGLEPKVVHRDIRFSVCFVLLEVCKLSPKESAATAVNVGLATKLLLVIQNGCNPVVKWLKCHLTNKALGKVLAPLLIKKHIISELSSEILAKADVVAEGYPSIHDHPHPAQLCDYCFLILDLLLQVGFLARTTKKLSDSLGYVAAAYNFDVVIESRNISSLSYLLKFLLKPMLLPKAIHDHPHPAQICDYW